MNKGDGTTSLELNPTTANLLAQLAETWGVSKEEAVRRAVEQARIANGAPDNPGRLEAFKELQLSLRLTPDKAAAWQEAIRNARR
jgi:hypothetical protein